MIHACFIYCSQVDVLISCKLIYRNLYNDLVLKDNSLRNYTFFLSLSRQISYTALVKWFVTDNNSIGTNPQLLREGYCRDCALCTLSHRIQAALCLSNNEQLSSQKSRVQKLGCQDNRAHYFGSHKTYIVW